MNSGASLRTWTRSVLCSAVLLGAATPSFAQNERACEAVIAARALEGATAGQPCAFLAGYIFNELRQKETVEILTPGALPVGSIFSQRDLQNRNTPQAALAGTPAQGQAVPGVQPAGVAAGTIAALGTDAGQDAIAAISVNPVVMFVADTATRQLARLSRLADVTVFVPVSGTPDAGGSIGGSRGKLRYIGARVRLNFSGVSAGSQIWNKADQLLRDRITSQARAAGALETLLRTAPDVAACADALLGAATIDEVTAGCGAPYGFTPDMAAARQLRDELATVRRAADARYVGVDFRYDSGDPTLGEIVDARGRFLFAGIAVGHRFSGRSTTTAGLRARLGLRHASLDATDRAEYAAEGGLGLELSRFVGDDELNVSGGIEFRWGNAPSDFIDRFQTNFAMLRGSLVVPVAAGNSISLNVGAPLTGDVSPIFSASFNWGLLLSNTPSRAR